MTQRFEVGIKFGVSKLSFANHLILCLATFLLSSGVLVEQALANSTWRSAPQENQKSGSEKKSETQNSKTTEQEKTKGGSSSKPIPTKSAQETGKPATLPGDSRPGSGKPAEIKKALASDDSPYKTATFLPQSTRAWVAVSSIDELETALGSTKFGQLATNEELTPVFENLKNQMEAWGDQQDQKFAVSLESLQPFSNGEICFAGVLNNQSRHAIVMIVDVTKKEQEVAKLFEDIEKELLKRGATKSVEEFHGFKTQKWNFKEPKGIRERESAFFAVVANRLVMCDDQETFAEVINRLGKSEYIGSLAESSAFKAIRKRCADPNQELAANIRWYIEPFGYIQLLDQIHKKNHRNAVGPSGGNQQELASKLKEQGFDGVQAFGGDVWIGTDDLELIHRGFIYAPPVSKEKRFKKAAKWLLELKNLETKIQPEPWVPDSVASYAAIRWDFEKGIVGVGQLVDSFVGEGRWKTLNQSFKEGRRGIKIDVMETAKNLDGKITIISEYLEPFNADSEKIVVGLKLKPGKGKFAADTLIGAFRKQPKYWKRDPKKGKLYWISKEVKAESGSIEDIDDFEDIEDEFKEDAPKEQPQEEPLFKKKVFVVHNDTLFFSNDEKYLQSIIEAKNRPSLEKKADWQKVTETMDRISPNPDCFRQFGRISKRLRLFYELLRQNKVPTDNGLFSKLMGKLQDKPKNLKKLDGKQLPADYEKAVAPYLGLAGWSLENDPEGWFFLGCILPKPEK